MTCQVVAKYIRVVARLVAPSVALVVRLTKPRRVKLSVAPRCLA